MKKNKQSPSVLLGAVALVSLIYWKQVLTIGGICLGAYCICKALKKKEPVRHRPRRRGRPPIVIINKHIYRKGMAST